MGLSWVLLGGFSGGCKGKKEVGDLVMCRLGWGGDGAWVCMYA